MSKKVRFPESTSHGPGPHYPQTPKQEMVFHGLIMAAAVAILLAGVKAASAIIAPALLALFATIILLVPLRWLQSKGCPGWLSLLIVLFCVAVLTIGLTRLVVVSLADLSKESRVYAKRIELEFNSLEEWLEKNGYRIVDLGFNKNTEAPPEPDETPEETGSVTDGNTKILPQETPLPEPVPIETGMPLPEEKTDQTADEPVTEGHENAESKTLLERAFDTLMPKHDDNTEEPTFSEEELPVLSHHPLPPPDLIELNAQGLLNLFTNTINELRNLVAKSFIVMIITLFMIFEASRFPAKIDRAFGRGPITNEHLHHIAREIRRYLFLKAISSLMSGVAAAAVYIWFGVPAALFWGVIAFFLYFIPNIGGIIASIIPGLLIFMQSDPIFGGPVGVMIYAVCLIAIECTIGYGIEPKILGHGLGISTVVIILSLITWGWLLGPIGLFLAAPLTIMVKIILQAFKETEWIAVLIGDGTKRSM